MSRTILVFGAGKSTAYLLDHILGKSAQEELKLVIADINPNSINAEVVSHPNCRVIQLDIFEDEKRKEIIQQATVVISMLPPKLHIKVAEDCLDQGKHLVTASYVSDAIQQLDGEAKKKGLVFINEIGLDPGIDHMSAMQVIDRIRDNGGKMLLFESFTGGLVAPEHDSNLWNYKFTWNPRKCCSCRSGGRRQVYSGRHLQVYSISKALPKDRIP